jgi:pimeloyl-ACP methyl ester carboxylesterase
MQYRTQRVELDGVTVAYVQTGTEKPETLVLSHSLYLNKRMFEAQLSDLAEHFNIVAYDHRGTAKVRPPSTIATTWTRFITTRPRSSRRSVSAQSISPEIPWAGSSPCDWRRAGRTWSGQ